MKKLLIIGGLLVAAVAGITVYTGNGELFQGMLSWNKLSNTGQNEQSLAKVKRITTTTVKKDELLKLIDELAELDKQKKYDEIAAKLPANEKNIFDNLMMINPPDETIGETFGAEAATKEVQNKKAANLHKIIAFASGVKERKVLDFWQNNYNAFIILDSGLNSTEKFRLVSCYGFEKRNGLKARKAEATAYDTPEFGKEKLAEMRRFCQTNLKETKRIEKTAKLVPAQYSVGAKRAYSVTLNGSLIDWGKYKSTYSTMNLPLKKGKNTLIVNLEKKGDFKDENMDKMLKTDFELQIKADGKTLIKVGNKDSDRDTEITETFTY